MKKILLIVLSLCMLTGAPAFAEIPMFDGGVIGDPTLTVGTYEYEEMFFLTGRPIKLIGTVVVPETAEVAEDGSQTLTYTYTLSNLDENIELTRTATYSIAKQENENLGQTSVSVKLTALAESLDVAGNEYTLGGYSFTKSMLEDNTAAVDYYSGNLIAKRKYYIGGDGTNANNEGILELETASDTLIGYRHYWGNSETQILKTTLSVTGSASDWSGDVLLKMSSTERNRFRFIPTDPQNISFRGNYVQTTNDENILQYTYNLPTVSGGEVNDNQRNLGEADLRRDKVTDSKSLVAPKVSDIGGHWAEDSIYLLSSLEVFNDGSKYFGPNLPVSRLQFAEALARAISDTEPFTDQELIRRDRDADKKNLFLDVDSKDPKLAYIEFVKQKGIMIGEGDFFMPDRTLRRSEAITILMNTLGLTDLAPAPPYRTHFTDDDEIPNWARDGIYMANEIGLVTGYRDGSIRPNALVTRAEASVLIEKFIRHIKDNITYDYREQILNNR